MQSVKNGDTVRVHYEGKLTNGNTFDSSKDRSPLEFEVGSGSVIKGFDEAVLEMKIGDRKTVHIEAQNAYGPRNEELIMDFPRANLPQDIFPEVGMELQMSNPEGQVFPVVIKEVGLENITLDANPPLAGKALIFNIELIEIA